MPRSRRRKGVVKGKTQSQVAMATRREREIREYYADLARRKRDREDALRKNPVDDKYANYPSNRG